MLSPGPSMFTGKGEGSVRQTNITARGRHVQHRGPNVQRGVNSGGLWCSPWGGLTLGVGVHLGVRVRGRGRAICIHKRKLSCCRELFRKTRVSGT